MADKATRAGDTGAATQYEDAAQSFAMKLVAEEASMKDLKGLHDQSITAAMAARKAVETNALNLQKQLAERSKLLSQLDNAKMQAALIMQDFWFAQAFSEASWPAQRQHWTTLTKQVRPHAT